eukprot:476136_1
MTNAPTTSTHNISPRVLPKALTSNPTISTTQNVYTSNPESHHQHDTECHDTHQYTECHDQLPYNHHDTEYHHLESFQKHTECVHLESHHQNAPTTSTHNILTSNPTTS